MPRVLDLSINNPKVKASYEKWQSSTRGLRKCMLDYWQLLELFARNCNTFCDIAIVAGITKQAVQQIYNRYFADIFLGKRGRTRRKVCTLKKHVLQRDVEKDKRLQKIAADHTIGKLITILKTKNLNFEVNKKGERNYHIKKLLINGKHCLIRHSAIANFTTRRCLRMYSKFSRLRLNDKTPEQFQLLILHCEVLGYPERWFIIPVDVIEGLEILYLPLKDLPIYRNNHSKINYWQYLDAWYLLE